MVETVFSVPGMGQLMVSSIFARDYLVVQAITLVLALGVVLTNFLADIAHGRARPAGRDVTATAIAAAAPGTAAAARAAHAHLCRRRDRPGLCVALAAAGAAARALRPDRAGLDVTLQPPSAVHWLGTDNFGRDILSRIIWGTRIDLQMGVFGVLFPFIIGTTIGAVSGYAGGVVDTLLMRLLDVTISFPFFVLIIAIVATLGPGLVSFYIALALVGWVSYARLVRAQFLVLKNADFVTAARCLGYSHGRIVFRHILPNAIMPAVVFSMSDAVIDILLGASLELSRASASSRRRRNGA